MKWPFLFATLILCAFAPTVYAITDPLGVPNNRVGVHILDTPEVQEAAKLVNSNSGDWGYVTVVIRSNDLDRQKWTKFFIENRKLHLIPIVRLATYPDGGTWVKPDAYDLVDFANFLKDMPWPTKNRYVVLFNEVNRANEWGNTVSPAEYSQILIEANQEFKTRSVDFFLISAGMDMSAPNSGTSLDALEFYRQMSRANPDWNDKIDGLAIHAYSNPGFSAPVTSKTRYGITSYRYEERALGISKPIFITETGWPSDVPFFNTAFTKIWTDNNIVAITPFVLHAASGDFAKFSLLDTASQPKSTYLEIINLSKISGSPLLSDFFPPTSGIMMTSSSGNLIASSPQIAVISLWKKLEKLWITIRGLTSVNIDAASLQVEIADTEAKRSQGLSGRLSMDQDLGMLFKFDQPGMYRFWMKDMNFGLDFIWIRGGKVVEISKNISPPLKTYGIPAIITPKEKIDQVIEVNAGWADKYDIKEGDILIHEQN